MNGDLHAIPPAVLLVLGLVAGARAENGGPFGELKLVQEVDCAKENADVPFAEKPAGVSRVEELLGTACRVLPNQEGDGKYFAYRIGKGKGLDPDDFYHIASELVYRTGYITGRTDEHAYWNAGDF